MAAYICLLDIRFFYYYFNPISIGFVADWVCILDSLAFNASVPFKMPISSAADHKCCNNFLRNPDLTWHVNRLPVNSGIFGQTAKLGQPLCLIHSSIIGIKK